MKEGEKKHKEWSAQHSARAPALRVADPTIKETKGKKTQRDLEVLLFYALSSSL